MCMCRVSTYLKMPPFSPRTILNMVGRIQSRHEGRLMFSTFENWLAVLGGLRVNISMKILFEPHHYVDHSMRKAIRTRAHE